jgi:HNH endonuclease
VSSAIRDDIRQSVRAAAGNRCGYCLSPQSLVLGPLEIEHLVPQAHGGPDDEENLWLACRLCSSFKASQTEALDPVSGTRVSLFNPRRDRWMDHFIWSDDGLRIFGKTERGRATVVALQLNNMIAVTVRRHWVAAGWHPPRSRSDSADRSS